VPALHVRALSAPAKPLKKTAKHIVPVLALTDTPTAKAAAIQAASATNKYSASEKVNHPLPNISKGRCEPRISQFFCF